MTLLLCGAAPATAQSPGGVVLVDPLEGQLEDDLPPPAEELAPPVELTPAEPPEPPALELRGPQVQETEPGSRWSVSVSVSPGATLRAEGLPAGATLVLGEDGQAVLWWWPGDRDLGDHAIRLVAERDGAVAEQTVRLSVREEWESFLVPGLGYVFFAPQARWLGRFHGLVVELTLFEWLYRNDRRGPSHGRVTAKAALGFADRRPSPELGSLTVGFDLSFERDPGRRFLVPYYGLDLGALQVGDTVFHVYPYVGVRLWASRALWLQLQGGYVLPGARLDELRGWQAGASASVSFW